MQAYFYILRDNAATSLNPIYNEKIRGSDDSEGGGAQTQGSETENGRNYV